MSYLPESFESDRLDPDDMAEDATPAAMLTSPDGAQFIVIGTDSDEYQGCLVRPNGIVEGYYRILDSSGGLTESLAPFHSEGWE